ncbi:DUF982 domain-containing protein [Shinella oryzae]|uniref:DUF982 domain-containing protein n=1 Tax=Shinella oryzae TaxID=2871820 RepID=A0ABY9KBR5_9HYPH|nr:DUF982 domain-containing protein [Shinella oryzae]MDP9588030.1 hypothetical protein [Shinella zoogloeoides]UPA27757.1 DUF982 domain-containing protein [Shinella oryzae]WLS05935.1 DUF982 domain-containing protein [Shinella oryzae]
MPIKAWSQPIKIQIGFGSRRVEGPFQALIHLAEHWPRRTGPRFVRAGIACKAAVEGRIDAEDARHEFLEAAKEVGLYLH